MRAFLFILLVAPSLFAQTWKDYMASGIQAASANNMVDAQKLLLRSVAEAEKFGTSDPRLGTALNTLGLVYVKSGKMSDAESCYRRALVVLQKAYGNDNVDVANVQYNLAGSLYESKNYLAAIEAYERSLPAFKHWFGSDGTKTARVLNNLGDCYRQSGNYPEAEKAAPRRRAHHRGKCRH